MQVILLLSTVFAFGAVCGIYLSFVGFAIVSMVTTATIWVLSSILGGVYGFGAIFGAFVIMQIAYGLSVIGRGLFLHIARLRGGRSAPVRGHLKPEQD